MRTPSPTSSKTLVNTKYVKTDTGIETFLRETEVTLLKVSLAPFFLWAVSCRAQNGSVNGLDLIVLAVVERGEGRVWCWKIFMVCCEC